MGYWPGLVRRVEAYRSVLGSDLRPVLMSLLLQGNEKASNTQLPSNHPHQRRHLSRRQKAMARRLGQPRGWILSQVFPDILAHRDTNK